MCWNTGTGKLNIVCNVHDANFNVCNQLFPALRNKQIRYTGNDVSIVFISQCMKSWLDRLKQVQVSNIKNVIFSGGSSPLCVFNNVSWKYST